MRWNASLTIFLAALLCAGCASLHRESLANATTATVVFEGGKTREIDVRALAPLLARAKWSPGFRLGKGYYELRFPNSDIVRMSWYGGFFWKKGRIGGVYELLPEDSGAFADWQSTAL